MEGHWFCFLIFMIFPKDLVVVIKCCNERKIPSFFSPNPMRFIAYGIFSYVKEMDFQIKG